ncbi:MAG: LPS biosynthesis protein WbpP, partial [Planctomycetaceae bacterium]|nr:LPS biosynthesis protein WbpP [Planctomycetaceae bacterium]
MRMYLVTGGAGFIGSHIVDALLERDYQVRVLDNLSTGNLKNLAHVRDRIEFFEGDVSESQAVAEAVQKVDCVFHQAALPSVPRSVENPLGTHHACTTGTLNVLNESRLAG